LHRFQIETKRKMAIKKSKLYSTLWRSCDELRGGMDASQYKDYVLVMLFVKYISDEAKLGKGKDLLRPKAAKAKGSFIRLRRLAGFKKLMIWKQTLNLNSPENLS
jgi:type I restriction enzyme M protein